MEAEAVLWAWAPYDSLVRRAGSLPSALSLLFPVWPQVGVSEAGLQHEILRRAQDLLAVPRVQPGTDSKLFLGLFRGCAWQSKGYWLQGRAVGTEWAMLGEDWGLRRQPWGSPILPSPDGAFPEEPGREAQPLAKGLCPAVPPLGGMRCPPLSEPQASEVSLTSELHKQSVQ